MAKRTEMVSVAEWSKALDLVSSLSGSSTAFVSLQSLDKHYSVSRQADKSGLLFNVLSATRVFYGD